MKKAPSAHFSPARFARLARLQLRAQARSLGFFWLIMLVVMTLVCAVRLVADDHGSVKTEEQMFWYYAGLFFSGYLMAHRVFGVWRRREAALLYLMQPASALEKWLVSALTILVLWPLLYTLSTSLLFVPVSWLSYQNELALHREYLAATDGRFHPHPERGAFAAFIPFLQSPPRSNVLFARVDLALWLLYAMLTGYAAFALTWFRRHATLGALALGIVLAITSLWVLSVGNLQDTLTWWFSPIPVVLSAPLGWALYALNLAFWLGVPALLWLAGWRALCEKDLT